jgi:uncharacterized protein (DUF2252 family)
VIGGRPLSVADRKAAGKAARAQVPLEGHAQFTPDPSRDAVGLLLGQAAGRVPDLVPIRHGRMLVSPFTFYRGAALVMAADLDTTPAAGLRTQLCGDAHLSNFGAYASPERRLVFDINDFDETFPGPFEWDVKRLAASIVVAGRENGFSAKQSRAATVAAVQSYRTAMREYAARPILDVWYAHVDVEEALAEYRALLDAREAKRRQALFRATDAALAKARTRDSLQAMRKLTAVVEGRRRIVSDPPLVVPLAELTGFDSDELLGRLQTLVADYRATLQPDRRQLLDQFRLTDVAHKVVGVGSVGTRAWVLLFEGSQEKEALVLQAKQAAPSALAGFLGGSGDGHEGERVVAGQRLMQATSDIFLGWLRSQPTGGEPVDYYVRQLRDWKVSAEIEAMYPLAITAYGRLCGATLARAHARAGDRIAIAAYLGKSDIFENAVADFAESYADQTGRDHAALVQAVAGGRVEARSGV